VYVFIFIFADNYVMLYRMNETDIYCRLVTLISRLSACSLCYFLFIVIVTIVIVVMLYYLLDVISRRSIR